MYCTGRNYVNINDSNFPGGLVCGDISHLCSNTNIKNINITKLCGGNTHVLAKNILHKIPQRGEGLKFDILHYVHIYSYKKRLIATTTKTK